MITYQIKEEFRPCIFPISLDTVTEQILRVLKKYWGYERFLPLQKEAMQCAGTGRDSLVVLPTGGGKSLCFQAPALVLPGMAVVISPLIALMKDQVDGLLECGVPAGRIDSSQNVREQRAVLGQVKAGNLKLLYVSPERLVSRGFVDMLRDRALSFIAVDEAHCISMWGHDFRPEYRQLASLKETFPGIAIHAYTATATEEVRKDIALQLGLEDPRILTGSFLRSNLVYRAQRRSNLLGQVCGVLDAHRSESGIIYCIKRTDVEKMCSRLREKGYSVAPYHAGMADEDRRQSQEAFINDRVQIIVATIAFGMGIDKPNVRFVIHAGMPKSLEHYQQESGRAGRDGLEAECALFFSGEDYAIWKSLMKNMPPEAGAVAAEKLNRMYRYCTGVTCRHGALLEYFGQDPGMEKCGACDVCLGHLDAMEKSLETSQKILSCIVRLHERFGTSYVASVLIGSRERRILENGHDSLSTFGLLSDYSAQVVLSWIDQLAAQGCIARSEEYRVLKVTPKGWQSLRGEVTPRLLEPARKPAKQAKIERDSWVDVDRALFQSLRELRRTIAQEKGLPAYMIFSDADLRDMARRKPVTPGELLAVRGVGEKKLALYGARFLELIGSCSLTSQ